MADEFPVFRDVFVSERDLYLCHSLHVAALPQTMTDGKPKPVNVSFSRIFFFIYL